MKRFCGRSSEEGSTLIVVLMIMIVIALVGTATLTQADTNVRATVQLRDQAGAVYNADGAAQVAVNALRKSTFDNDASSATFPQCFGASGTLNLPNFYPATGGGYGAAASSAAVTCTAEAGTGVAGSPVPVSSANKPGNAILTLSTTETGQTYGQANKAVNIHGGVVSDSSIDSSSAALTVSGAGIGVNAVGACIGSISPACTHNPGISDPNYPAPTTLPAPPASLPACNKTNKVAEFLPGLYTSADTFNNCQASWIYFDPGVYYFDFTTGSTHVWTISGTVVAGALTSAKTDAAPAVPGACVNPINTTAASGVEFAFGGDSQVVFAKGAGFEACATYSATSIPTVVYGLKANIGSGANIAHAQSGCITLAAGSGNCNLFNVPGNGTKPDFYFQGFVYAPRSTADLSVNNTSAQHFNFGVVFRTLALSTTGSAGTAAIISLPDNSPGYGTASTIVDLTVYVCPGASTCSTGGRLQLTARVLIHDPSGSPIAGAREMKTLSWGQQS
jgi:Tfp pilus assembly protein PilX